LLLLLTSFFHFDLSTALFNHSFGIIED
jgi:hypothetical protein